MSLNNERKIALKQTYTFLLDLLDPQKTPRVPRYVRKRAGVCLRHYPEQHRIDEIQFERKDISDANLRVVLDAVKDWNPAWGKEPVQFK